MPDFISYTFTGLNEIVKNLETVIPKLRPANRDLARMAGRILVKEMKARSPVGTHYSFHGNEVVVSQPETLKKSILFRTFDRGESNVELKIYAAPHAVFVINPTRRHIIRAKKGKFLRFFWPGAPLAIVTAFGGNVVYFKQVTHPGTKGNPFNKDAFQAVSPKIEDLMTQYGSAVIEAVVGQQGRFFF